VVQLFGTLVLIGAPIANAPKLCALLVWWLVTFRRLTRAEVRLYFAGCLAFTVLDVLSLRRGVFRFTQPDMLGLPLYEVGLWGFYLLHATRMIGARPVPRPDWRAWALFFAFVPAFSAFDDPALILVSSAAVLAAALTLFHTPRDLFFVGYLALVGTAVEYVGVHRGEWSYPHSPIGGVPFWYLTMWGGVGFFLHRLALPLLQTTKDAPTTTHARALQKTE
jgi:hypothetical protein